MAITRITATRDMTEALGYVLKEEAHTEGVPRFLVANGLNCDPDNASVQMLLTREAFEKNGINPKTGKKYLQGYRVIQSFDPTDFDKDNPKDIALANKIGLELAKELYPNSETVVVTQTDGKGRKVHNHILTSSIDFHTGRQHRAEQIQWQNIANLSDKIHEKYKLNTLKPVNENDNRSSATHAEISLRERGAYVWKDDIKDKINSALNDEYSTDLGAFTEVLGSKGVELFYRRNDRKKDFSSYQFVDDEGKQRKIRPNKLGEEYSAEALRRQFEENKKNAQAVPDKTQENMNNTIESMLAEIRKEKEEAEQEEEIIELPEEEETIEELAEAVPEELPEEPEEEDKDEDEKRPISQAEALRLSLLGDSIGQREKVILERRKAELVANRSKIISKPVYDEKGKAISKKYRFNGRELQGSDLEIMKQIEQQEKRRKEEEDKKKDKKELEKTIQNEVER